MLEGFQSALRSGLTLTVGQEAVVNFTLEVGAVSQTIEVTAEAPLVNTTSASLGALVGADAVADLPLNGRNYIDLTFLQAGISKNENRSSGTFVGAVSATGRAAVEQLHAGRPDANVPAARRLMRNTRWNRGIGCRVHQNLPAEYG